MTDKIDIVVSRDEIAQVLLRLPRDHYISTPLSDPGNIFFLRDKHSPNTHIVTATRRDGGDYEIQDLQPVFDSNWNGDMTNVRFAVPDLRELMRNFCRILIERVELSGHEALEVFETLERGSECPPIVQREEIIRYLVENNVVKSDDRRLHSKDSITDEKRREA